jgi:hypothetical protein
MARAPKILDYNKMKAPELKKLCEQREIQCKLVVKDMVEALKLEEVGKWIFHTEQVKQKGGGYIIKIDYRNNSEEVFAMIKYEKDPINPGFKILFFSV